MNRVISIVSLTAFFAGCSNSTPLSSEQILIQELSTPELTVKTMPISEYFHQKMVEPIDILEIKNREKILKAIVERVTENSNDSLQAAKMWTEFLQDKLVHPKKPPILNNKQAIYDPIWLLDNKLSHCGQTNRLILDGLKTIGIEGRLVQLTNHVIAEVFIDGKPIALDADLLDGGRFFYKSNGEIASAQEIYESPEILNVLKSQVYTEYDVFSDKLLTKNYWWNYLREGFAEKPFYYVKTAEGDKLENVYYGWNYYQTEN